MHASEVVCFYTARLSQLVQPSGYGVCNPKGLTASQLPATNHLELLIGKKKFKGQRMKTGARNCFDATFI